MAVAPQKTSAPSGMESRLEQGGGAGAERLSAPHLGTAEDR